MVSPRDFDGFSTHSVTTRLPGKPNPQAFHNYLKLYG